MHSILEYEKLVYSIVSKYSYNNNDLEDLYQEGMKALQKASEKYNSDYNSQFSTFAYLYIKGAVLKYLKENRLIKVNKDMIKLNKLINKSKEVLQQKYLREASLDEVADFLEIPVQKVIECIESMEYVRSLDYELNEEGKEMNLYDSVSYEEKGYNEDIIDLRNEIEKLDSRDKNLIKLRYYEDKSQQETSKVLGMTQVQVSRSETKILTKLRTKLVA